MKEVDLRPLGDCKGSASRVENKIYFAKSANNQHKNSFLGLVVCAFINKIAEFFLSLSMSDGRGCRAYIFVWIFFDESSGLKNLAVLNHKEVGNKIFTLGVYILRSIGSVYAIYSLRGCLCCLFLWWAAKALSSG